MFLIRFLLRQFISPTRLFASTVLCECDDTRGDQSCQMSKHDSTTLIEMSAVNVIQKNKRSMMRASLFHSCSSRLTMTASGSTSSPSRPSSGSSAGASIASHCTSCPLISLKAAAWRSLAVAVAAMNPLRVAADNTPPNPDMWPGARCAAFFERNARAGASPLPLVLWSLERDDDGLCSARRQYSLIWQPRHYCHSTSFHAARRWSPYILLLCCLPFLKS